MQFDDISLIVLAGGQNKRFNGKNKAFVKFDEISFLDRIFMSLRSLFKESIIVTNKPEEYDNYPFACITEDIYKGKGPLAGIHAGLSKISTPMAFIVSCDTPMVERIYAHHMALQYSNETSDCLIPRIETKTEPLFGLYNTNCISKIENYFENSNTNSIQAIFPLLDTKFYTPEFTSSFVASIRNINSNEDLQKLKQNL